MSAHPELAAPVGAPPGGLGRWWIYQRERFPLLAHGPLILAFAGGAVSYSARLRGASPTASSVLVAFVSCLAFFFLLRVSDEHKDLEEDTRWRPYRPVPRGLVSLAELRRAAWGAMAVQGALALWLAPTLLVPLVATWAFIGLMTIEFGIGRWLHERPMMVIASHMLVMPFVDFYAMACDWMSAGGVPAAGLGWFLVASYANGIVVEVGRKLRAPSDEEPGVLTYTARYGVWRAGALWLLAMLATAYAALRAVHPLGSGLLIVGLLGTLLLLSTAAVLLLAVAPRHGRGRLLEALAGIWTIAVYLGVGFLPAYNIFSP